MELHQISVAYDPPADRVLLVVRGRDGDQLAGWLTRRLMLRLWPVLQGVVTDIAAAALPAGAGTLPEARTLMGEMRRAEAIQQADFTTPFERSPARHPMGPEPLLITEVNLGALAGGSLRIDFRSVDGRSFNLQLAQDMVQAWMHLTEKALAASEWALPPEEAGATAIAAGRGPTLLN